MQFIIMKMVQLDKCFILFSVYLNIKIELKKKNFLYCFISILNIFYYYIIF